MIRLLILFSNDSYFMFKYLFIFSFFITLSTSSSQANASDYTYYGFEPDIITNYVTVKKKMGFVRLNRRANGGRR